MLLDSKNTIKGSKNKKRKLSRFKDSELNTLKYQKLKRDGKNYS